MSELKANIHWDAAPVQEAKKPEWLKARLPSGELFFRLRKQLHEKGLNTICQSARCPNINECWNHHHATFLAMGNICSRQCSFCAVAKGHPLPIDPREGEKILEIVSTLNLTYLVITSVTRDDLPDRGGAHLAAILQTLKGRLPHLLVEMLVPDFSGKWEHLDCVLDASPDVLGHNVETVRDMYPVVSRSRENYEVSLGLLEYAKQKQKVTKTGIMVGLGETPEQLLGLFSDLRDIHVDLLTIGQYLQPSPQSLPVARFYSPDEFVDLRQTALKYGFSGVESGPFVRSSYHAESLYHRVQNEISHI